MTMIWIQLVLHIIAWLKIHNQHVYLVKLLLPAKGSMKWLIQSLIL